MLFSARVPQRADTEDAYPPPRLGMVVVDEVYAKVGAANDVVIVRRPDGSLTVSDFHVSTDHGFLVAYGVRHAGLIVGDT